MMRKKSLINVQTRENVADLDEHACDSVKILTSLSGQLTLSIQLRGAIAQVIHSTYDEYNAKAAPQWAHDQRICICKDV